MIINFSVAQAQLINFNSGDVILSNELNQNFQTIKQEIINRGHSINFQNFESNHPITSSKLNQNVEQFKLMIPSNDFILSERNQIISASQINNKFQLMMNLINQNQNLNSRDCSPTNGSGTQLYSNNSWGACNYTCSANYWKKDGLCKMPKSCLEVLSFGGTVTQMYNITPVGKPMVTVYCDQTRDGGGWTFFPNSAMGNNNIVDWNAYRTNTSKVLLYMTASSIVRYQVISQLSEYTSLPIQIINEGGSTVLKFVPNVVLGTLNGFRYNNTTWSIINSDSNPNSMMVFTNSNQSSGNLNILPAIINTLWSTSVNANISNYPSSTTHFSGGFIGFGGGGTAVSSNHFPFNFWTFGIK